MQYLLSIILLFSFLNVFSQSLEDFTKSFERKGLINDYVDLLDSLEEVALEKKIIYLEKKFGVEGVICLIDSLNGYAIDDVATEFGNSWKVGEKFRQKGILFLIAAKDKKVFIATSSGINKHLKDEKLQNIVDNLLIPHLKTGKYYYALSIGIDEIEKVLKKSSFGNESSLNKIWTLIGLLALIFAGCFIFFRYFKVDEFKPETKKYDHYPNDGIGFGSGGFNSDFGGEFDGSGVGGSFGGDGGGGDGGGE